MQIQHINNAIPIQVMQQNNTNQHLFQEGTTIQAKIVNVENNIMTLEMPDGTQFKAENLSGTALQAGDTVQLMISNSQGGKATGSVVAINDQPITQNVTDTQMHLTEIGQSASQTHVRLASLFSKFNYPMTKAAFDNLVKILEAFPKLPEDLAVFMAANNIEPTEQNIHSLQSIGHLHQEIQNVVDEINTVLTHLPLEQFAPAENTDQAVVSESEMPLLQEQMPAQTEQVPDQHNIATVIVNDDIDIAGFLQQAVQDGALEQQMPVITEQAVNFVLSDLPDSIQTPLVKTLLTAVVSDAIQQLSQGTPKAELTLPPQIYQLVEALPMQSAENVMKLVPQMQALTHKFLAMQALEGTKDALFAKVNEEISGGVIRQTMENTPARLLELGNLRLSDSWNQVANTVKLGDQSMTYMQIPIQINQREQTGELYVFQRPGGKNKKNGDDSTKVVFALNTQYVGRFESIITANKMDLQLNIRLDNQKIKAMVDNHLDTLERLLSKTKYNLVNLTTSTIEKRITVSNVHEVFGYKQLDIQI